MAKTHTTLTIDTNLLEEAKGLGINISGALSDYLKSIVQAHNEDIEGINIKIEKKKIEKYQKKIVELKGLLTAAETRVKKWEEIKKAREAEKLEKEKKAIENAKKCISCGIIIEGQKVHNFKAGIVCNGCLMGASAKKVAEWSK